MASGIIKTKYPAEGFKNGTAITTSLPVNQYTNVMRITLTPGTWLIIAHGECESYFQEGFYVALRRGGNMIQESVIRGSGIAGGGLTTTVLEKVESSTPYNLALWHGNASPQIATRRLLRAIRLSE